MNYLNMINSISQKKQRRNKKMNTTYWTYKASPNTVLATFYNL